MVVSIIATEEDRLLLNNYRIYNGMKIDIRWSGGWLTPEGEYKPVDYSNNITHETIAQEYVWRYPCNPKFPATLCCFYAGWIRISYFESSTFCVEYREIFYPNDNQINEQNKFKIQSFKLRRLNNLLRFARDFKTGFDSYFINDVEYKNYRDFMAAIRSTSKIIPTSVLSKIKAKLSWKSFVSNFRLS